MSVQIETSTFEKRICIKKDTRRGVLFHEEKKEGQAAETEEDADSVTVIYYYIL